MPSKHGLIELRHLRYFLAVAETGSVSEAAARRLFTSQPSLSRQIRDLEMQVGAALFMRRARGVELTPAGEAFRDHALLALTQVEAGVEAARRVAQPEKQRFGLGFLTGQEMKWLSSAMRVLQAQLPAIDVTVSSDYSPQLADSIARGRVDVAFMRAEPGFDLDYRVVRQEPLVVLMPSDHPLTQFTAIDPGQLHGLPFIAMASKAQALRAVVDRYLERVGVTVVQAQSVDNPAMVMSLVASTRSVTLIPDYVKDLMPWSVVSRPLAGEPPTIDLVVGFSRTNASELLQLFLSQLEDVIAGVQLG